MALFQSGPRFNFDEEEARPKLFKPRFSIPANIEPLIRKAADESGVPFERLAATVKAESNFNPSARSGVGAIGLAQLMPGTAKDLGVNPYDPEQNLRGGARYLKKMYDKFGDWDLAHGSYNAGPGRIKNRQLPKIRETQDYVKKINALLVPEEGGGQDPSIPSPAYPNQPLAERLKTDDAPTLPPENMNTVMGEALAGANKKESFGKKFARALGFGSDSPEYDEYGIEKPKPKGGGVSNILGILLPTLVSMFGGAGAFPGLAAGYFGQRAGRAKQYNDDVERYDEARKAKMKLLEPPEDPADIRTAKWLMGASPEEKKAYQEMMKAKVEANPYAAANLQMRQDNAAYQRDRDRQLDDRHALEFADKLEEKKTTQQDRAIERLSGKLGNSQDAVNTIDEVEKLTGFNLDDYDPKTGAVNGKKVDLPGVSVPGLGRVNFYNKDARTLNSAASKLFNIQLKDRSGAAVTANEMERIKDEWAKGKYNTEQEMIDALQRYKRSLTETMKNIETGFSPNIVGEYEERGGTTSKRLLKKQPQPSVAQPVQESGSVHTKYQLDRPYTPEEALAELERRKRGGL